MSILLRANNFPPTLSPFHPLYRQRLEQMAESVRKYRDIEIELHRVIVEVPPIGGGDEIPIFHAIIRGSPVPIPDTFNRWLYGWDKTRPSLDGFGYEIITGAGAESSDDAGNTTAFNLAEQINTAETAAHGTDLEPGNPDITITLNEIPAGTPVRMFKEFDSGEAAGVPGDPGEPPSLRFSFSEVNSLRVVCEIPPP